MQTAGTMLGPYKVADLIGAGGMGEVYRARDTRLARDVAVKVITSGLAGDAERLRRFEREARAAGALNHPNVIAVYDLGTHAGAPYVVMELLEGKSLREVLRDGAIAWRKAADIAAQVASGLAAAHAKGIVHRDLKPENVFVMRDGRVKVLDFGLAKLTQPNGAGSAEVALTESLLPTESGAILGTMGYMSPEQVRRGTVDARSDVFALGAVLHEMLSGERVFRRASQVETLHAILKDDVPPLATAGHEVPHALELIVRHCLEKEPLQRFQNAGDLAFDLEALSRGSGGSEADLPSARFVAKRRRPIGLVVVAIAALGVAAASLALLASKQAELKEMSGRAARVRYQSIPMLEGKKTVGGARFAPDGETIYYTASRDENPLELFETKAGQLSPRSIGLQGYGLRSISKTGTMLLSKDGSLAELPIIGGTPRQILEDISAADWLPDGKTLAVVHSVAGKSRLEMPPGHVIYESPTGIKALRFSASGQWLAFQELTNPPNVRGRVVIMDTQGKIAARSFERRTQPGQLAWSKDDTEVWFTGPGPGDDLGSSLRAMSPGGRVRVIQMFPTEVGAGLWDIGQDGRVLLAFGHSGEGGIRGRRSPASEEIDLTAVYSGVPEALSSDGQTLLLSETGSVGGRLYAACLRGMDGSPPVRIGEGRAVDLSPDGKRVLTIRTGPPQRLVILSTTTGDSTSVPQGSIARYGSGRWLPNGKGIVFFGGDSGAPVRTYVQDLAGGLPRPITPEGVGTRVISPDGRFVAGCQGKQLIIFPIGSGAPRTVGERSGDENLLQWSEDGRSLYLEQHREATVGVTRLEMETGKRTLWKTLTCQVPAGARLGRILFSSNLQAYVYTWGERSTQTLNVVEGLE